MQYWGVTLKIRVVILCYVAGGCGNANCINMSTWNLVCFFQRCYLLPLTGSSTVIDTQCLLFSSPLFNYIETSSIVSRDPQAQTTLFLLGKSLVWLYPIFFNYSWKCCVKDNNHNWNLRALLLPTKVKEANATSKTLFHYNIIIHCSHHLSSHWLKAYS